jgi:tRNA threonylcarbamoyladenosine biosynthesis protein TsaB
MTEDQILLAADTGAAVNTIAICRGRAGAPGMAVLAEIYAECGRAHSERLLDGMDRVLAEAGADIRDVDVLAIAAGPGSFTGLRIGASAWKGLAYALERPLIAVPSLDAMARLAAAGGGVVCVLLDARMKEVYGAVYRVQEGHPEKTVPDRVCPVEEILDLLEDGALFTGDGALRCREVIEARFPRARFTPPWLAGPRASAVAAEAFALIAAGCPADPALMSPVYLRQFQTGMNRAAGGAG